MIRVHLVERRKLGAQSLAESIGGLPGFELSGVSSNRHQALSACRSKSADLVVVGSLCSMGSDHGKRPAEEWRYSPTDYVSLLEDLVSQRKESSLLAMVPCCSLVPEFVGRVLRVGVQCAIDYDVSLGEFGAALKAAATGERFYSSRVLYANAVHAGLASVNGGASGRPLSNREMDVSLLLSRGLTGSQTAKRLCLSEETIATHRKRIFRKTGVKSVSELIWWMLRMGYLAVDDA